MTAKEYLRQIGISRERVKRLRDTINDTLYDMRMVSSPSFDERVQTSPRDRMPEYAARLDKYECKLQREIEREEKLIIRICQQIDRMDGIGKPDQVEHQRRVLYLRYVECIQSFSKIADIMVYSESRIHQIHSTALQAFARQYLRK